MKLPEPSQQEVRDCDPHGDTLKLLRWWVFCNFVEDEKGSIVKDEIKAKLESVNAEHLAAIEGAVGYGFS